jgi:RecA/RadA recombinase
LSWLAASAFQKQNPDGAVIFYDSEFGTTNSYLEGLGIDVSRVVHIPVMNIEELKFDIMAKLKGLTSNDKVFILVDSLGNIASLKEVEDADNEKSVADMTRAKQMKGLFRMITPVIAKNEFFFCGIAHTYEGMGMFAKTEISGGTGLMYASNTSLILSKSKEKDGSDQVGVNINITVRKSRYMTEGERFSATLNFDTGFKQFSGIVDIAVELGHMIKPSNGFYQFLDKESGELLYDGKKFRLKEAEEKQYMIELLRSEHFRRDVKNRFMLVKEDGVTIEDLVI